MIKFSKIVRDLKEYLFGKEQKKSHTLPAEPLPMVATPPQSLTAARSIRPPKLKYLPPVRKAAQASHQHPVSPTLFKSASISGLHFQSAYAGML